MTEMPTPTPRELEILKVLWEEGPSSVRDVHRHLSRNGQPSRNGELAYNTVQTLLRIMEEKKGLVEHHVEGRTFIYTACYDRDESTARFLDRVFDVMKQPAGCLSIDSHRPGRVCGPGGS